MSTAAMLENPAVREFILSQRVAHLATSSAAGVPHAVPFCFCLIGERIYFVIDEKPKQRPKGGIRRMRNIAENPRVAVIFDHYEDNWNQLAYVLVHGRAQSVEQPREYETALEALAARYIQYRATPMVAARNPMVRIETERVHLWGARFKELSRR